MRTMYDSTRAANIPASAGMVAGYVDEYMIPKWTDAEWARFPHAVKVRIAKKATTDDGHVLDVEDRLATPEEAPGWARMRRRSGLAFPTIYCNRSTWPRVRAEFDQQGEPQPLYFIATASGEAEIPDGAIAAQYLLDTDQNTDISVVADYWPGVDPAPQPPNPIPAKEAQHMQPQSLPYAADYETTAFPVEAGSNSAVVKDGWVSLLSTFGSSDYELIAIDGGRVVNFDGPIQYDNNTPAPSKGTLGENSRIFAKFPDSCDGLALRYKNNSPGARLGIAFPQITK